MREGLIMYISIEYIISMSGFGIIEYRHGSCRTLYLVVLVLSSIATGHVEHFTWLF